MQLSSSGCLLFRNCTYNYEQRFALLQLVARGSRSARGCHDSLRCHGDRPLNAYKFAETAVLLLSYIPCALRFRSNIDTIRDSTICGNISYQFIHIASMVSMWHVFDVFECLFFCQTATGGKPKPGFGHSLLMTQSVACAVASFASGFVVKYVARLKIIVGAAVTIEGIVTVMLVFPSLSVTLRFVAAVAWGAAVATLQTQLLGKRTPVSLTSLSLTQLSPNPLSLTSLSLTGLVRTYCSLVNGFSCCC